MEEQRKNPAPSSRTPRAITQVPIKTKDTPSPSGMMTLEDVVNFAIANAKPQRIPRKRSTKPSASELNDETATSSPSQIKKRKRPTQIPTTTPTTQTKNADGNKKAKIVADNQQHSVQHSSPLATEKDNKRKREEAPIKTNESVPNSNQSLQATTNEATKTQEKKRKVEGT